ncbi:hypothetical protein HYT84_01090 [Candidatus Micrarchaeota archaeon]|nr:hypothetical protein [Candidatus Micrarchaeota archaeon]
MENLFQDLSDSLKNKVVNSWKQMGETEKTHFINQVSLALSIWGSDTMGKKIVVEVIKKMMENGSSNLSDFGLYIQETMAMKAGSHVEKMKRALNIIDNYRMKNALPSEPHKDFGI